MTAKQAPAANGAVLAAREQQALVLRARGSLMRQATMLSASVKSSEFALRRATSGRSKARRTTSRGGGLARWCSRDPNCSEDAGRALVSRKQVTGPTWPVRTIAGWCSAAASWWEGALAPSEAAKFRLRSGGAGRRAASMCIAAEISLLKRPELLTKPSVDDTFATTNSKQNH